jgi:hypothetical protein
MAPVVLRRLLCLDKTTGDAGNSIAKIKTSMIMTLNVLEQVAGVTERLAEGIEQFRKSIVEGAMTFGRSEANNKAT